MMKKLTSIFALVALCATAAMATDTRVLTLGDNHEVLVDDANVFLFPSRISQFPNIAIAEIGNYYYYDEIDTQQGGFSSDVTRLGVNWKFGTENPWMLGTYFYNGAQNPLFGASDNVFNIVNQLAAPYFFSEIDNLENQRVDLIYGRKLGNLNFGFALGLTGSSYKSTIPTPEFEESAGQLRVGVGLSDQAYTWDVAAHVAMNSFKQENDGVTNFESDGSMDFNLIGRWFHSVNPQWTIVPVVGVGFGTLAVDVPGTTTPSVVLAENIKSTSFMAMGGVGIHYMPSNNVLAVLQPGIAIGSWKREYTRATTPTATNFENKEDEIVLPYFKMGVEGDVFPWLDARFGATSYWLSEKFTSTDAGTDESEETYNSPDNRTYLGLGFNFGRVHIDTYTNPQLFLSGFDFISGQNSGQMNLQISALMELF